ncbi:MAG: ATP-dependent Clp protease ATP-binding subunit, partial [Kiritimatiellae bacterium]|nr:ATP-dependent Clp protease ATP-binding subunit [Kiritimatiellia bacterium]
MSNDYTPNANQALDGAEAAARRYNHSYIGTEHLLCSILAIPNCGACRRFRALGVDPDELRIQLEQMIGHSENVRMRGDIPVTARTRKILELAKLEARRLQASAVGTEHIILAILAEGESVAAQILSGHGLTPEAFAKAESQADDEPLPDEPVPDDAAEGEDDDAPAPDGEAKSSKKGKTPALNIFGRDLTALARKGELDPVIGRKQELVRVVQVLSRRKKNNAVLIGEAGVG